LADAGIGLGRRSAERVETAQRTSMKHDATGNSFLGEQSRLGIREAGVIRSYLIRLGGTPMQQNNLFAMIHKN
jgi:hypothetical protein